MKANAIVVAGQQNRGEGVSLNCGHCPSKRVHDGPEFARLLLPWVIFCVGVLLPVCGWSEPLSLFGPSYENTPVTTYAGAPGEQAPKSHTDLPAWLAQHQRIAGVNMTGGHFWLVTQFTPSAKNDRWVVAVANTWFQRARVVVLGDNGVRRAFDVGDASSGGTILQQGVAVDLPPGHRYTILASVTAPFYTSLPRIDVQSPGSYRQRLINETVLTLGALGLLGGLGFFIVFVGLWIRDYSFLLYGLQTLILMLGWSFYFGLPHDWLGMDTGRINFTAWFIVLPIVHALFTIQFLELGKLAPSLRNIGYAIAAISALALPVSLLFPSKAFLIASALVSLVVAFSTFSGIWALIRGARRARFFVLAYLAVLLPGLAILPANLGLTHDFVDNSDLLTLIGNGCEALILAFALADYVRLVERARERFRHGMQEAIAQASIDPMTRLGNRLAFDVMVEEITSQSTPGEQSALQIAMIDLDGLKRINDTEGHHRGDELLLSASDGLHALQNDDARAFRIGGDEFAVIVAGSDLARQRLVNALRALDRSLREKGFANTGISYGICSTPNRGHLSSADIAGLVRNADRAMYAHKAQRQVDRDSGRLVSS